MAKFCGKCGAKLNEKGRCPDCDKETKLNVLQFDNRSIEANNANIQQDALGKKTKAVKNTKKKKAFFRMIALLLCFAILISSVSGILVYFDVVDIPFISSALKSLGIKSDEDSQFNSLTAKFTNIKIIDEASAIEAAQEATQQLGLGNAADELSPKNQTQVDGLTYYRLQQNYKGIPVYGRTMIVIADENGNAKGFATNSVNISDHIDTTQDTDNNSLINAVVDFFNSDEESIKISNKEKIIYNFEVPELCYRISVILSNNTSSFCTAIVSAKDAKVISVDVALNPAEICTSSTGLDFSGSKNSNGEYVLFDKDKKFYCLTANGNSTYSYSKKEWNDNSATAITSNSRVFDAQYDEAFIASEEINKISDFYSDNFSDKGTENFALIIQCGTGTTGGLLPISISNDLMEISDIDKEVGVIQIGSKSEVFPDTVTLAHEYTHVITNNQVHWVSGVDFKNEAQAINEAYSDLFGMIINEKINHENEFIWDSGRTDVSDLSKDNYPLKVNSYETEIIRGLVGDSDDEYVDVLWLKDINKAYTYSYAVTLEHAAYLMSSDNTEFGQLSIDEISSLWYNTMLTLPSNCTFSVLRENMEMVAEITGLSDEKRSCISKAFDEVGIKTQGSEFSTSFEVTVTDSNGDICTDYTIEITGTKSSVFWEKETIYQDTIVVSGEQTHKINLPEGSYELKIIETQTGNSVSRKIRTAKLSRKSKLNISLINSATKISNSEYIANQLLGEWEADADKTYLETNKSLQDLFGTGIKNGSSMKFDEDGTFSYYIGIGNGGKGTYTVTPESITYDITTYEENKNETGNILIDDSNNELYLITEYSGDKIYWKQRLSESNIDTDALTAYQNQLSLNSDSYYMLYDMDDNGLPELIIRSGTCEADYRFEFYSYDSGIIFCGDVGAGHSNLAISDDGIGLLLCYQHMDYESRWLLKLENCQIFSEAIFEGEEVDYTKVENLNYLDEYESSDITMLLSYFCDSYIDEESNVEADISGSDYELTITDSSSISDIQKALIGRWYTKKSANTFYEFAEDGSCRTLFDDAEPGTYEITSDKTLIIRMPWETQSLDWESGSLNMRKGWCISSDGQLIIKGVEYSRDF